jgi:hypothetical protein
MDEKKIETVCDEIVMAYSENLDTFEIIQLRELVAKIIYSYIKSTNSNMEDVHYLEQ